MLPILHLNGAKIAGPTVLGRKPPAEVRSLFEGHGYEVIEVEGSDLPGMHHRFAAALAKAYATITEIQRVGPHRALGRPTATLADDHPAQPQGLDRAGRGRRDQGHRHLALAPGAAVGRPGEPGTPALLEDWLRSYRPEELFDADGAPTELVLAANVAG